MEPSKKAVVLTGNREAFSTSRENLVRCICGRNMVSDSSMNEYCNGPACHRGESGSVNVNPEAERWMDVNNVRNDTWFHVTSNPDWHNAVRDAGVPVHIGSLEASMHRQNTLNGYCEEWFLYEIGIDSDATIANHFTFDIVDDWPHLLDSSFDWVSKRSDFVRYVNEFEAPGSISLYGDPNFLHIKRVLTLDPATREFNPLLVAA